MLFFLLLSYTLPLAESQSVGIQCSNTPLEHVVAKQAYNQQRVASTIFPAMKDQICKNSGEGSCSGTDLTTCIDGITIANGTASHNALLTMNKTAIIIPGEEQDRSQCPTVMDQIFKKCMGQGKASGSTTYKNVYYSIAFEPAPQAQPPTSDPDADSVYDAFPQWMKDGIMDYELAFPDPVGPPKCFFKSAKNLPPGLILKDEDASPNLLLGRIVDIICTNQCRLPEDLPGDDWESLYMLYQTDAGECEVSVPIQNDIEGYMYRSRALTEGEQQQCRDTAADMLNICIKNGPNKASSGGPSLPPPPGPNKPGSQSSRRDSSSTQDSLRKRDLPLLPDPPKYELGFRYLNDPTDRHTEDFTGTHYIRSTEHFDPICFAQIQSQAIGDVNSVLSNADTFCRALAQQPSSVVLNAQKTRSQFTPLQFAGQASGGKTLYFDLLWDATACERGMSRDIVLSSISVDQCKAFIRDITDRGCDYGGARRAKCGYWAVSAGDAAVHLPVP